MKKERFELERNNEEKRQKKRYKEVEIDEKFKDNEENEADVCRKNRERQVEMKTTNKKLKNQ